MNKDIVAHVKKAEFIHKWNRFRWHTLPLLLDQLIVPKENTILKKALWTQTTALNPCWWPFIFSLCRIPLLKQQGKYRCSMYIYCTEYTCSLATERHPFCSSVCEKPHATLHSQDWTVSHICLRKLSLPSEAGGWLDRKKFSHALLSQSSPDIMLETWLASSVVINLCKGSTVGGQLPTERQYTKLNAVSYLWRTRSWRERRWWR